MRSGGDQVWKFKEGVPIYTQLIEQIRMGIVNGTYPPGSKMPAVRELALQAGVNPNTMQRALSELERDKLLHAERTSGRFVTEDENILHGLRESLLEEYVSEFLEKAEHLGVSDAQILAAVKRRSEGLCPR